MFEKFENVRKSSKIDPDIEITRIFQFPNLDDPYSVHDDSRQVISPNRTKTNSLPGWLLSHQQQQQQSGIHTKSFTNTNAPQKVHYKKTASV